MNYTATFVDPPGTLVTTSAVALVKIDSSSIVHFKIGETLRFDVEGWFKDDGGTTTATVYHDPADRDSVGPLSFHVPFKLHPHYNIINLRYSV